MFTGVAGYAIATPKLFFYGLFIKLIVNISDLIIIFPSYINGLKNICYFVAIKVCNQISIK